MILTSCNQKYDPVVIKLIRRDGSETLCKTGRGYMDCKPGKVFLNCNPGYHYDCTLEQGEIVK